MIKGEKLKTDLAKIVTKYGFNADSIEFFEDSCSWYIPHYTPEMHLEIKSLCSLLGIDPNGVDWSAEDIEVFVTDEWYDTDYDEEFVG